MKLKYFAILTGVLAVGIGGLIAKSQISNPKPLRSFVVTSTMSYLLLKAQRMAVTKTEFIVLQKAA